MEQERIDTVQLSEQVKQLLESKNFREIRTLLDQLPAQDCAQVLENLPGEERTCRPCSGCFPRKTLRNPLWKCPPTSSSCLFRCFPTRELKAVFDEMFVDDTVDVIEEMPPTW